MSEKVYPVPASWKKRAFIDEAGYKKMYAESVKDPDKFWAKQAKRLDWFKAPTKIKNTSFAYDKVSIKWFEDGVLNVSYNCIDRHLKKRGQPDGDHLGRRRPLRRQEDHLRRTPCAGLPHRQCAEAARRQEGRPRHHLHADDPGGGLCHAGLRAHRRRPFRGLRRLLAGFAGRPHQRLQFQVRSSPPTKACAAGKKVPLKANTDEALKRCAGNEKVLVVRRTGGSGADLIPGRDFWYHEEAAKVSADCKPEKMKAEDPLFILYTSGSTGKPKGVLHTTGGYLVYAAMTPPVCLRLP